MKMKPCTPVGIIPRNCTNVADARLFKRTMSHKILTLLDITVSHENVPLYFDCNFLIFIDFIGFFIANSETTKFILSRHVLVLVLVVHVLPFL